MTQPISDITYELCTKTSVSPKLAQTVISDLHEMIPEEDHGVLERAMNEEMQIFPDVNPLYKVISFSDSTSSVYYINLEKYTCSCEYYLYNCTSTEKYCKHIWRVLGLIKYNYLPDNTESTYQWVLTNLTDDIQNTFRENDITQYQKLQQLEKILSTEGPNNINYEYLLYKWASLKHPTLDIPNPLNNIKTHTEQNVLYDF